MVLPDGFSSLVELVIQDWDWEELPTSTFEIWDALLYPIFLGRSVKSAQAAYAKQVLGHMIDFDAAQSIPNDGTWSKKVSKLIDMEISAVRGTAGAGYKKAILETVRQQVVSLSVSQTIGDALKFFSDQEICVELMAALQADEKNTKELVALIARDIFNVRYIKGVLWLYSCGIGKDIVPPNAHTITFLDNCGYNWFSWSRNPPADWEIFAPACNAMKDVAKKVSSELGKPVTPKQSQFAAWYLQTSKSLLKSHKNKLTPRLLLEYLDSRSLNIHEFNDMLDNVEEIDNIANDLKVFLG
jgi:hypothetical protein